MEKAIHTSVMKEEILSFLDCKEGGVYLDGTFGGGGHTKAILEAAPLARVVAFDCDLDAIEEGVFHFKPYLGERLKLIRANFVDVENAGEDPFDGAVLDLGVSLDQLQRRKRGFSFLAEEPLDMRMDMNVSLTASDLLHRSSYQDLTSLLWLYGEEEKARSIAQKIVQYRNHKSIETARELSSLIVSVKAQGGRRFRHHPATKTFQALRIAVNQELEHLRKAIPKIYELLSPGARLCILSFHSLEDRIVKEAFKKLGGVLTKKPLTPSLEEVMYNPRARSAKLRVLERQ